MKDKMSIAVKVELEIAGSKFELTINQLKELRTLIDVALNAKNKGSDNEEFIKKLKDIKPVLPPYDRPYPSPLTPWWEVKRDEIPMYHVGDVIPDPNIVTC